MSVASPTDSVHLIRSGFPPLEYQDSITAISASLVVNFVLAVFRCAGFPLVHWDTWPQRNENRSCRNGPWHSWARRLPRRNEKRVSSLIESRERSGAYVAARQRSVAPPARIGFPASLQSRHHWRK